MNIPKFELFESNNNNEFYFRLKAGNGEIILSSEGYKTKSSCLNGIDSVKSNSQVNKNYARLKARNGEYYFNLNTANGETIGSSETYVSKQGLKNGIKSVIRNAPIAEIRILQNTECHSPTSKQQREFNIIVNGREKVISERILSFLDIVKLAFGSVISNGKTIYTMTFKKGDNNRPEGTLVEGDKIKIKSGVIFNVTATDKS